MWVVKLGVGCRVLAMFRESVASTCVSFTKSRLCLVLLPAGREVWHGVGMSEDKVKSGWQLAVGSVWERACFVDLSWHSTILCLVGQKQPPISSRNDQTSKDTAAGAGWFCWWW